MADARAEYEIRARDRSRTAVNSAIGGFQRLARVAAVAAGGAAIAGIGAGIRDIAIEGDKLDKLSQRVQETVENLSRLDFAASRSGSSLQAAVPAIERLNIAIAEAQRGGGQQRGALARLGLDAAELANLNPTQQIQVIADGLGIIGDRAERARVEQVLFGRAVADLRPFLRQGSEGIQQLFDRLDEIGGTRSTQAASNAAAFNDSLEDLGRVADGVSTKLGERLLPALTDVVNRLVDGAPQARAFADGVASIVGSTLDSLSSAASDVFNSTLFSLNRTAINAVAGLAGEGVDAVIAAGQRVNDETQRGIIRNEQLADSVDTVADATDNVTRFQRLYNRELRDQAIAADRANAKLDEIIALRNRASAIRDQFQLNNINPGQFQEVDFRFNAVNTQTQPQEIRSRQLDDVVGQLKIIEQALRAQTAVFQ